MDVAREASYPTPYAQSALFLPLLVSLATQKNAPNTCDEFSDEYDYIIVGAGSAGSVVASRLAEEKCVTVLLLEAGGGAPHLNDIPAAGRNFWFTDLDWQYKTVPQKNTGNGLMDRQVIWPSGKALGGSSVLNAMLYVRGNKKNYDDWEASGATGWRHEDVFPYFLKLENNTDPLYVNNGFHSDKGPLSAVRPPYDAEIKKPLLDTATEQGFEIVDSNGARQTGFYDYEATIRNGQRCSTAKAYLVPAEDKDNLSILSGAHVRKIIVKKGVATGVQFDWRNKTREVRARREVILSAGTTNTAQLLMLSGIGPKEELDKFDIPVVADLPVGKNMQDHCSVLLFYELDPSIEEFLQKVTDDSNIQQYIDNRTGPLAVAEGVATFAFLNGRDSSELVDNPNYQIYFVESTSIIPKTQLGMLPEVYEAVFGPYENKPIFACFSSILQPRSRGTVTLHSNDPYDPPVIDPNYYDDPEDLEDVVQGLLMCNQIATSDLMQKVGSKPFNTTYPGCEGLDEKGTMQCVAQSVSVTLSHQVGTAKMGQPGDPTTVVDPELRVKGVRNLRVVDASVMPIIPSGNTNVPTIMLAEKASDIIKGSIKCKRWLRRNHCCKSNKRRGMFIGK